jgi:hypothetical protein
MADQAISAFAAYTATPTIATDPLPIVDLTASATKKVTLTTIDTYLSQTTNTLTNKTLTSPKLNENVAVTTTATRLNYLTSAAGTTGTPSTNIVYSTSPVLTTPTLGVATATRLGVGGAADANHLLDISAGGSTSAPILLNSGSILSSPAAGAVEYDGAQFYGTIDAASGQAAIPVEQYFHLASAGSNVTAIANYFGSNSNMTLVSGAYYDIEIIMYYIKTTAGTVTWTLTNSQAPTAQNIYYEMSPVTGMIAPPGTATMLVGQIYNDNTAARTVVTASLTGAPTNHYARFRIQLRNATGVSLKIQATCGAGSITPGANSYWICKRRAAGNVGVFVA